MIKKLLTTAFVLVLATGTLAVAEISNDAKLQYNRGVDLYRMGQFNEAVSAFQQAVAIDANYIDAYYNLGVVLEQLNRNEDALNVFKQIIVRKPSDYEAVYNAASLSYKVGQIENAKKYLSIIPTSNPIITKVEQLAAMMNTDLQTIKSEQQAKIEAEKPKLPQTSGSYGNLSSPTGVATDKNGNVYIASFSDNSILKITPTGERKIFVKSPKLNGPMGMVSDSAGNLYVANYSANNIVKVTPSGTVTQIFGNVKKPYCLFLDGNLLFISSQGGNSVIRYKLNN